MATTITSPTQALRDLLAQRILVLDGAWGTMLQQQGLEDADYRGERFRDHPREVAGDRGHGGTELLVAGGGFRRGLGAGCAGGGTGGGA